MAATAPPQKPLSFTHHPSLNLFNVSSQDYLLNNPQYSRLIASALIFSPQNKLLLVQRAPTDFGANLWEVPGGSCDADETVLASAVRELWEESGLVATEVVAQVGEGWSWKEGESKVWFKASFLVEVESTDGVKLDPEEHQNFLWASEEECRDGVVRNGDEGVVIRWIGKEQEEICLEGFRLRREVGARKTGSG